MRFRDVAACFLVGAAVGLIVIAVSLATAAVPVVPKSASSLASLDDPAQCWRLHRHHVGCEGDGINAYANLSRYN